MHAASPRHPQCNHTDQDPMAMRVNDGVQPIKCPPGTSRGGSRPKPPKAVARRASLEAPRSAPDHHKAKRRLTDKTVAFSTESVGSLHSGAATARVEVRLTNRPAALRLRA